jgi:hypothetical protein
MLLVVEENVTLDPIHAGLLGANRVMFKPDRLTHPIQ